MSKRNAERRDLPSLKAIQAFEAAGRLASFTRAADELLVTQGAISRHVRNLEGHLGMPLFNRVGRRLELTPDGRNFLAITGDAFDRIALGIRQLRSRRAADTLTVSMLPSLAAKWLAPRLGDFLASHPEVTLQISASRHFVDFERDGIDAAIRYGRGQWPGVEAQLLIREDVRPVCSPALAAGPPPLRSVDDLARMTLLHSDIREDWRAWLDAAGAPHIEPSRGPHFNEDLTLLQATTDGLGVALGRSALIARDVAEGRLVAPFATVLPTSFSYWLVTPRERTPHKHLPAFVAWVLNQVAADQPPAALHDLKS